MLIPTSLKIDFKNLTSKAVQTLKFQIRKNETEEEKARVFNILYPPAIPEDAVTAVQESASRIYNEEVTQLKIDQSSFEGYVGCYIELRFHELNLTWLAIKLTVSKTANDLHKGACEENKLFGIGDVSLYDNNDAILYTRSKIDTQPISFGLDIIFIDNQYSPPPVQAPAEFDINIL